jgi:hypothetical protein
MRHATIERPDQPKMPIRPFAKGRSSLTVDVEPTVEKSVAER